MQTALRSLSNSELISKTEDLCAEERRLTAEVLEHLREIERRRVFAIMGFPSMHAFCVQHLKYSEGAAFRRISAMRLTRDLPEVEQKIETGEVSLSTASTLQAFLTAERKQKKRLFD